MARRAVLLSGAVALMVALSACQGSVECFDMPGDDCDQIAAAAVDSALVLEAVVEERDVVLLPTSRELDPDEWCS
jgi:hypothetical protein